LDVDIRTPDNLVGILELFFEYEPPAYEQWGEAVEEFKLRIPEYAQSALEIIQQERRTNKRFVQAFDEFTEVCRTSINPNLSVQAVEEMLIQHLLTERLFRKVFNNPDFVRRNAIAAEIEKVIDALTSQAFSRKEFLKKLDRFYGAIEMTAATIDDYAEKQDFMNTVYEKFFQGFSVKVADTHGIVYTPQPIVDFMVRSVEEILKREFGRSLSDEGVHVLDPFVGTGNFILRVMREIKPSSLEMKYSQELHCNEVMLLPYYIAAQNIEHAYYETTGEYRPFEGLCLVDTFQLAEGQQMTLSFVTADNTERVKRQKEAPIFVILGNPPYNAHQVNENDNQKNRKYEVMDTRVSETYAKDSQATNKNALSDPYIKSFRWASDRIVQTGEGIVAYISNNSFINDNLFNGMRKHLEHDFSAIYHVNLKGNARTTGEQRRREGGNVFEDAIRVSVGITFLVKKKDSSEKAKIYLTSVDDYLKGDAKQDYLTEAGKIWSLPFELMISNERNNWLTEDMINDFETLTPMGSLESKGGIGDGVIFCTFSNGVKTNRDAWAYNFRKDELSTNIKTMIETYNDHVSRWQRLSPKPDMDTFVLNDSKKISWSRDLKLDVQRGKLVDFSTSAIKKAIYRPFTAQYLYFDRVLNEEVYQIGRIFPINKSETENLVICVTNHSQIPFSAIMTANIPEVAIGGRTGQVFPFYTYDEDGSNRQENISDWALEQFRANYEDNSISKWDIFHYVYALLHQPAYREKYAANLKRDLPHIPFTQDFWGYAEAGKKLADLHVNYESQPEYPLELVENTEVHVNWRVEKMKLSKDKTELVYNDFLTMRGIPAEAFEYRLGNRSALDWVIDQYRVKEDKRSKIVNDPNNMDDPQYIVRLVKMAITVSLETVQIVKKLA